MLDVDPWYQIQRCFEELPSVGVMIETGGAKNIIELKLRSS
jgi:hypothetical protein